MSISLDLFGDRWSLLLVRDVMVRGYRTFRDLQNSGEGIATNILANRLRHLQATGILVAEPAADDRRSIHYRLTPKGIALAPVLLELLLWAGCYEDTAAPCAVLAQMEENRLAILAETHRRWLERDPTPILPPFPGPQTNSKGKKKQ